MGTNFYLQRVKPREIHDRMHICKRSAGWKIHFQDSADGWADPHVGGQPKPPEFHSVAEIRALLESEEWQIADEYGEVWAPGQESLELFDKLLAWNGGKQFTQPAVEKSPYVPYDNPPNTPYDHGGYPGEYRDKDGYAFTSRWFR